MRRRSFLQTALATPLLTQANSDPADLDQRIRGLMFGTALGDALGGPIEFQQREAIQRLPDPPKIWADEDRLDGLALAAAAKRLVLRSYKDLRPKPESYGQWNHDSAPGTITDDTRHKLVCLEALHMADRTGAWPMDAKVLAKAFLEWSELPAIKAKAEYKDLAADWLEETLYSARWTLGARDLNVARPPDRLWVGLSTCMGQMILLPLAAVFAGDPARAYRAAHALAFFDNGVAKELVGSIVAGLSVALVTPCDPKSAAPAWQRILAAMRETDPYGYGKVRWTERPVLRWLNWAERQAKEADGRPARLFAAMEKEFGDNSKWEAHVTFAVPFACLALGGYDPLAGLQLSMEWGHDSDSYAQIAGAFVGALHGPDLFPQAWRDAVATRVKADFGVDLEEECRFLGRLRRLAQRRELVQEV